MGVFNIRHLQINYISSFSSPLSSKSMRVGGDNGCQYVISDEKNARKKEVVYVCIAVLITNCMRAEIRGDKKLLIDLEWPYL